jgi:hypothetical protein
LEKAGVLVWFFDGKCGGGCVVKRGAKAPLFRERKTRHFFQLYFLPVPKLGN